MNLLPCKGVDTGVIHDRGGSAGGGVIVLHLFRCVVIPLQAQSQFYRIGKGGAGMAGHQIRHQVLLFSVFLAVKEIPVAECFIYAEIGFPHTAQNRRGTMLRGNL